MSDWPVNDGGRGVDFAKENLQLRRDCDSDAEVFKRLPGFRPIQFKNIAIPSIKTR